MQASDTNFRIDSFKFLPKSMIPQFKEFPYQADGVVKAAPAVPLNKARVALLTSGGLYQKDRQPSFDLERERREPLWGDPTYRVISRDLSQDEVAVAHLHLNPDDILADFNVALPLRVFAEFERDGKIGSLAHDNYSFMGYQGRSSAAWHDIYGPELARRLRADAVDLLILAPT
jgi:glycine/betaine/sarcosine/D-proline reductase family selenoprotein B